MSYRTVEMDGSGPIAPCFGNQTDGNPEKSDWCADKIGRFPGCKPGKRSTFGYPILRFSSNAQAVKGVRSKKQMKLVTSDLEHVVTPLPAKKS